MCGVINNSAGRPHGRRRPAIAQAGYGTRKAVIVQPNRLMYEC